jgi:hypothetical protein
MHEYYIDEKECQVSPGMKDAFVLCRVTKRSDWALENDNEVGDRNPHHQQQIDAATSIVKPEDAATAVVNPEDAATSVVKPEDAATSVVKPEDATASLICAGESNDVAMASITADKESPNCSNELEAWLEELLDPSPSFNPLPDTGSAILPLTEQYAESSNTGSVVPKIGPDHASPIKDGTDATDYLFTDDLPDDLYNMLYPGIDEFSNNMFLEPAGLSGASATNQAYHLMGESPFALPNNFEDGTLKDELQLDQENNNPNLSNGNIDNGVIIRRRSASSSAANISLAPDNSGRRLDLMTSVECKKKHANDATSVKQSDAAKPGEGHNNQGYLRGIKNAFRCSSAGFNAYILFTIFLVGVAAAAALHYHRSGASL